MNKLLHTSPTSAAGSRHALADKTILSHMAHSHAKSLLQQSHSQELRGDCQIKQLSVWAPQDTLKKTCKLFQLAKTQDSPRPDLTELELGEGYPTHTSSPGHYSIISQAKNNPLPFPFCFTLGFQLSGHLQTHSEWFVDDFKIHSTLEGGNRKCNWHKSIQWSINIFTVCWECSMREFCLVHWSALRYIFIISSQEMFITQPQHSQVCFPRAAISSFWPTRLATIS